VVCEPIAADVYVDRDMWEKIVLNLLSNALKFTFDGAIRLELRPRDHAVELTVRDTGVGIPPHELPRIFERFHRVEGVRSRTYEGSGIGLALTHELVRLHGGTIEATSEPGRGSTFVVRVPTGRQHLPPDSIDTNVDADAGSAVVRPFVSEASRWQAGPPQPARPTATEAAGARSSILIADDNADMRDYLQQILSPDFDIELATDGQFALEAARARRPDLIVTDVMMPRVDGFELLRALRHDPAISSIPVLMLSARAGEDARVSGLDAGADDYVVKPFSARELLARVRSLVALSQARREAELQKQHLRALFMQAPTPIVMLRGADHVIELANPMTCRVWGRREDQVVGRPLLEALPELMDQPFKAYLDHVFQTGETYLGKETPAQLNVSGDGTIATVWFNFVYAPLKGVDGRIEGVLVLAFDVTDEVTARRELSQMRIAAESANRAKDEFLAILGHELRNPLAPIVTALELMRLRGDGESMPERQIINRQVRHLTRLVEDLLDVSRIAEGKIDLRRRVTEMADIVAAAVETVRPQIADRHQDLSIVVPDTGLRIDGDVTRLVQVIGNLLSNASKYTPARGQIALEVSRRDDMVEVRVRDTGIGISPEMLPRIFELFAQEPQALHRAAGGLGLGLTIVRSLVRLHGGTVEAHSDGIDRGSEFIVRLPLHHH
jgi:PAS domain S-box-containing protein